MIALNLLKKRLLSAILLSLLANLPAAAQVRVPTTGQVIECPVVPYQSGAAFIVECTPRWSGMVIADATVNGYSGLLFCSYDAVGHLCPEPGVISVKDHPAPLVNGILTCTADWGAHVDQLRFACTQ